MASAILLSTVLRVLAPAEPAEPSALEPVAEAPEPKPEGLTPVTDRRTEKGWVPNNWPVQQRCDFLTTPFRGPD